MLYSYKSFCAVALSGAGRTAGARKVKPAVAARVPHYVLCGRRRARIFIKDAQFFAVFFIFMNDCVTKQIVGMRSGGMKFGTERTRALLDALGSPDDKLKIIHVAGSNGKGSACAYLTHILLACGKTVGTYTTPEVFSFEEQYLVNGKASAELCEKYLSAVQRAADNMDDKPTAYERQTAAAYLMFAEEGCEYAVIECCMGGLLDTTNAANKKGVAVITSVSLEHTAWLGGTLEEIARHKAGIIKDCPAVISRCVPEEVRGIFYSLGAVLSDGPTDIEEGENGTFFTCGGVRCFTRMKGCRQPFNAAAAITAAKLLGFGGEEVKRGVASAELAGRLQEVRARGRLYILDGAHNPESFIPLTALLKGKYGALRRTVIYGCLNDKDIKTVLGELEGCAESVVAVQPESYRAMDGQKILSECRAVFGKARLAPSVGDALGVADGDVVVVCGTFTILKEAYEWIEKRQ